MDTAAKALRSFASHEIGAEVVCSAKLLFDNGGAALALKIGFEQAFL
ncbi:MAG: hypothetical protein IPI49_23785 [Myxococcales bacterium]|nr:hypothetical protein [Myxococcales bacterium]